MLAENVKVGMKVHFGRRNGEKTLGEVVKINRTKCKVKQLEDRGSIRDYPIGTMWTVPFSLMNPADPNAVPANQGASPANFVPGHVPPAPNRAPLKFNPFDDNNALYSALLGVYCDLSPENLSCDGEASAAHIRRMSAELNRKKRGLEIAIGHAVDEGELYEWERERAKYEREQAAKKTA